MRQETAGWVSRQFLTMNVLRSLAREMWNLMDASRASTSAVPKPGEQSLNAVRQQRVAPVLNLSRYRDSFEQFPQGVQGTWRALRRERAFQPQVSAATLQRDGFDLGRRSPVDLSGGVKAAPLASKRDAVQASPIAPTAFTASLDDLAAAF
jgi:hypothetical protein